MLLIEISGIEGSGKTSLALSSYEVDPPVDYADFDGNFWQAAGRFLQPIKDGVIRVETFGELGDDEKDEKKIRAEWQHFRSWLDKKLQEDKGTIVLDTFDYAASLIKYSLIPGFREGMDLRPNAHEPANAWLDGLIARGKKSKRTIILMNKVKNPWEIIGQSEAGKNQWGYNRNKWERALPVHFADTLKYAIHLSLFTGAMVTQPSEEQTKKAAESGGKLQAPKAVAIFTAKYEECKPNKLLVGKTVYGPTLQKMLGDEQIQAALELARMGFGPK